MFVKNMNNIKDLLANQSQLFPDRQIRNNDHLVKEEIWELLVKENPKLVRKMFFIKTSKIPVHKLLQFKKESEQTTNFSKAFYGKVKYFNINLDKK